MLEKIMTFNKEPMIHLASDSGQEKLLFQDFDADSWSATSASAEPERFWEFSCANQAQRIG